MSIRNSSDTIGNRTRDLPACSTVPQPTAPPRNWHVVSLKLGHDHIPPNFIFQVTVTRSFEATQDELITASLNKQHRSTLMFCWPCIIVYQYNVSWLWHGGTVAHLPQPTDIIGTQYTKRRLWAPPEDGQVMLETCRGPWFTINWMKSASRWFHYTEITTYSVIFQ
jgi:hypothetical protein